MRPRVPSAVLILLLCVTSALSAQTTTVISDTGKVTWTASVDQTTTFGTPPAPVLTSYKADLYLRANVTFSGGVATATTGSPAFSFDWGKPTPDGSNVISGPALKPLIQPNAEYVAFISASGPGGSSRSAVGSVPFGFPTAPRAPLAPSIVP